MGDLKSTCSCCCTFIKAIMIHLYFCFRMKKALKFKFELRRQNLTLTFSPLSHLKYTSINFHYSHACDATEQSKAGGRFSFASISNSLFASGRYRDCHGDGLVEFPPSGLHSNNRAEGRTVTSDSPHHVLWHWLCLREINRHREKQY